MDHSPVLRPTTAADDDRNLHVLRDVLETIVDGGHRSGWA
jgi:hypothetical protein